MAKSSSHDATNPYELISNWKSGKLTYWRNSNLYSEETKAKLEARLKADIESHKLPTEFDESPKRAQR